MVEKNKRMIYPLLIKMQKNLAHCAEALYIEYYWGSFEKLNQKTLKYAFNLIDFYKLKKKSTIYNSV